MKCFTEMQQTHGLKENSAYYATLASCRQYLGSGKIELSDVLLEKLMNIFFLVFILENGWRKRPQKKKKAKDKKKTKKKGGKKQNKQRRRKIHENRRKKSGRKGFEKHTDVKGMPVCQLQ